MLVKKYLIVMTTEDMINSNNEFFYSMERTIREGFQIVDGSRLIGAGLATIALGGVGAGVGFVFGKLLEGLSRNVEEEQRLTRTALIGFAITEALGLFALMIAFLILYGA